MNDKELQELAEIHGFDYIRKANNRKLLLRRKDCGHIVTKNHNNLKNKVCSKDMCFECVHERRLNVAKEKGLKFIRHERGDLCLYRVNKCSHTIVLSTSNLFNTSGEYKCTKCYSEKENTILETKNIEVVSRKYRFHNGRYKSLFMYTACNHTFEAYDYQIKSNYSDCKVCKDNQFKELLSISDLELINKISSTKGLYRFKNCGHTREIDRAAIVRGNFVCQECNSSHKLKPSNLYILKFTTNCGYEFLKLGYGKNVNNRIREYTLKDIRGVEIILEVQVITGNVARKIENSIHNDLKAYKIDSNNIRKYLTKSGFSECYEISMLNSLIDTVNYKITTQGGIGE